MLILHTILQHICQFFRGLTVKVTKRMYRSSAVFMAGAAVVTVVAFTSTGFGGGGKNGITAFAETPALEAEDLEAVGEAEEENVTQAKVQVQLTDFKKQAQLLAGNQLEKDVQQKQEIREHAKEELMLLTAKIASDNEEAVRRAEEEAKRIAKEKAIRIAEEAKKQEKAERIAAAQVSEDDYQVLLKIVQAEAGGCDAKGKILVANVVLNRVRSSQFPNSVRSVVYEPSQFSPVMNGSINTVKVSSDTKNCVDRALSGEDYSQGALYFMNRSGARSRAIGWFDSRLTYLFKHGGHEFFK